MRRSPQGARTIGALIIEAPPPHPQAIADHPQSGRPMTIATAKQATIHADAPRGCIANRI